MEPSSIPGRAKRGCLWYFGIAAAGALGLLLLFVTAVTVSVLNEPSQHSIVVSAYDRTSLEAETTNHGEGFLDGYDWLEVYYVRSNWFQNKRVQVYNIPHVNVSDVSFRRRLDHNGQVQIEITKGGANRDSIVLATFVPPASFPDK